MRALIILMVILLPISSFARDRSGKYPNYILNYRKEIKLITEHLNSLTTLQADFVQTSSDGNQVTGKFYLSRPGKFRWQYNPPAQILVVANGNQLIYYDKELDEVSYLALDKSLAGFIARKEIKFRGDDINIQKLSRADNEMSITVANRNNPDEGKLQLVFSKAPIKIKEFNVISVDGESSNVRLSNLKTGVSLDKKLFRIERDFLKKRRNQ